MRTGQRDVHNLPKRRLSISYEELETLKKSIKVSVINELRAEMEGLSDQESLKDTVLSEIRTELMGIPNPALLKASILNELRMELKAPRNDLEAADRRLKDIAGVQDGLLRELLDQKTIIRKLETEVVNLTKKIEEMKNTFQVPTPAFSFISHEDPLDLPPLSKKPKHAPEFR
jgi:chromosome segregation ATPase